MTTVEAGVVIQGGTPAVGRGTFSFGASRGRSWRIQRRILSVLLVCLAGALAGLSQLHDSPYAHAQRHSSTAVPSSLAPQLSSNIGASQPGFWPVRHGSSFTARGGGIQSSFSGSGVELGVAQGTLGLSLAGVGRAGHLEPVAVVRPTSSANEVLYGHGSLTELYRNGPYGLEQGFTLKQRPRAGSGPLVLSLSLDGTLTPQRVGSQIDFRNAMGQTALRYGRLSAVDSAGRQLPAHLRLSGGALQLVIDDSDARYPLRIDPFVQQGEKLTGAGEIGEAEFGASIALSSDGDTALVGAPNDVPGGENSREVTGGAWVFTRSGSTWSQGERLVTGGVHSVALSGDGDTALIGTPNEGRCHKGCHGTVRLFTRSGSIWTEATLAATAELPTYLAGWTVALSADGTTALVGGNGYEVNSGGGNPRVDAVSVLTRVDATWTTQATFRFGPTTEDAYGGPSSLALSGDGDVALVGDPATGPTLGGDDTGKALIFTRSGSEWTAPRGEPLIPMNQTGSGSYGSIVALSADGKTALVGDPGENGFGAVLAFTDSASGWVQDGPRITAAGRPRGFGKSVALSADGNTALIGAGEGVTGAAFLFKRTGPTWTQQPGNLSVEYELGDGNFGSSIALSADGDSAVIGADGQRPEPPMAGAGPAIGAAYPFEFVAESPEPPAAITGAASSITPTSAELSATVNPQGGRVTRCRFEYGPTESYGESAPCYPSPGSGEGPVSVSASVTRLSPGTAYHFRITARNRSGRRSGLDQQFMTESPRAPTVFADPASSITSDSATLNATVDPNGGRIRSCRFEYGTTTSYGSSVRCPVAAGAGEGPVTESLDVPGLAEDTEYYFRIVARNATGSSYDGARAFTTASRGSLVQLAPGTPTEGGSIALSADGSTLLVGSSDDDWGGSVRIYVRSGPGWRLQARLVDGEIDANFGDPVAVSSDGNTALIGSSGEGGDEGDADVFTRTGGVWSEQASLAGTPRFILTYWGGLLALSGDGDTALVGSSFRDHLFLGERAGSKWAPASAQIPALVAEGHPEEHPYLSGLAISADGSTVLVRLSGSGSYLVNGEPELEDAGASVVLAFTLSGSTWQAQTLDPTAAIGEPDFGSSMTLSDDGNTALIGGPGDDGGVGAAWAFTRSGTTWTQGGEKLTADNETGAGDFGSSVALSADGSRALIGGPDDDAGAGAAWTFTRSGESFTQQPSKLTSSEGGTGFGSSVSLTGEGNEAVIAGDGGFWTFGPEPEGDPHRHHR